MPAPIALQLYSVRDAVAKSSFADVVKQVAAIGYAGVEPAGFPGSTPAAAAKLFRELGLAVPSGHLPLPIGDKKNEVFDTMAVLGCQRAVAGFGPDQFKTADLIKKAADQCNEASAGLKAQGWSLGLHNHWWEFLKVDGRYAYEIMLDHLAPEVFLEVDTYWAKTAGADPVAELKKIGKRAPLLHIKDGPCKQGEPMTAVGDGVMDFPAIAKVTARTAQWWIVELDSCATDMMEAVRKSHQFLTSKNLAKGSKA